MVGFENYARQAAEIEREIIRRGIVLGIDWQDEVAVRALAREALGYHPNGDNGNAKVSRDDTPERRAKIELFGLAELMLKVMAESATDNIETHGGEIWKAFGRALWKESESGGEGTDA